MYWLNETLFLGANFILKISTLASFFFLSFSFRLKSFTDESGEEQEVQRLHEDSDDLIQWPNTVGYVYTSIGIPLSEESTRRAYDIFNKIKAEARTYFDSRETRRGGGAASGGSPVRAKTRLLTFYNSRMRKAMEVVRKEEGPALAEEVETILSGEII